MKRWRFVTMVAALQLSACNQFADKVEKSDYTDGPRLNTIKQDVTYDLPPGFSDPGMVNPPVIWNPTAGRCSVVYAPSLTTKTGFGLAIPFAMPPGGSIITDNENYFFYFPIQNVVLSFINPRIPRIYPKDTWHPSYSISVNFDEYKGGFPPGFNDLRDDAIGGDVSRPVPGDNYALLMKARWPFIKRSASSFDIPKYCSFNQSCFCLRS